MAKKTTRAKSKQSKSESSKSTTSNVTAGYAGSVLKSIRNSLEKKLDINFEDSLEKVPHLFAEALWKYFRIEVEGLENIPAKGSAIIIPNHSGFAGFDAILLSHAIRTYKKRIPRVLTHKLWFSHPLSSGFMQHYGFVEAKANIGDEKLKKNKLLVLFPEGEDGNFKPTVKAYKLQEFRRGFVRLSLINQVPVIPVLILGAEESQLNLKQIDFSFLVKGLSIPLPFNLIPLPTRWKIKVLPPVEFPFSPSKANDFELLRDLASDMRGKMQRAMNEELKKRKKIFF